MIRTPVLSVLFWMLTGFFSVMAETSKLSCKGPLEQGGFVLCTIPEAAGRLSLRSSNGSTAQISAHHPAFIPFSRNSPLQITLRTSNPDGQKKIEPLHLNLQKGQWAIERIDGLKPGKVTPRTVQQQKKVEADWIKKQAAWKHRANKIWYANGFAKPVEVYRTSGVYGSQRILNGTPKSPHLGLDFAAPKGTPIHAPAAARVVLAEPDMYFEGGFVVLDHGDGVMSVMLHMSRLDVTVGDKISKGQVIGAIGMTGRATGPHLHWGIKVRGTYINPALVLNMENQD